MNVRRMAPTRGASAVKVYVSVDMEGLAGIVSHSQVIPGEPLYVEGRSLLTREVHVIVDALKLCGAETVIVKDAHYAGMNLFVDRLHPGASYCMGPLPVPHRFAGLDQSFDTAMLIGYHARVGTMAAIRDHTMTSTHWQSVELNGQPIGEIGLDSLLFGMWGVPISLVSGDQATVQETRSVLGDQVVTVTTKLAYGRHAGVLRAPEAVYEEYRAAVGRAVHAVPTLRPFHLPGPYELVIRYTSTDLVDGKYVDGIRDRRLDGVTVCYTDTHLMSLFARAF